jgi:hypothetical protein
VIAMATCIGNTIRVEMPVSGNSKAMTECKTIGDLKTKHPNLKFVKYIYTDPSDGKTKGANPPDKLPLIENSFISVIGNISNIVEFSEYITG